MLPDELDDFGEEWRAIPGYKDYLISESGHVYQKPRVLPDGRHWKGKMLKESMKSGKYRSLGLQVDGVWGNRYIHHLVAETFIGPRPDGMKVLHIDEDNLNNHRSNLRYGTQSENIRQAYASGRKKYYNRHTGQFMDKMDPAAAR